MPDYRRWYVPGGTYFFTVVTLGRRRILWMTSPGSVFTGQWKGCGRSGRSRWWPSCCCPTICTRCGRSRRAMRTIRRGGSGSRRSLRWATWRPAAERCRRMSRGCGRASGASGNDGIGNTPCADEEDLKRCVDYVHWNPRKHGYAASVRDWRWSSFHRYVESAEYGLDWGAVDPTPGYDEPEWGE